MQMSVCVWHFPLSGDTWIRVYLTFCLRHLSCSICKTIFAYKLQQQPAWSLTYSTQVERPARIYSIKIQRQGGKVRESKGKRGKHAWQCMTKVMNYLSPSPTAHNRTYGPRFQSGCSCGLHKSLPFPPKKKEKWQKMENREKGKTRKRSCRSVMRCEFVCICLLDLKWATSVCLLMQLHPLPSLGEMIERVLCICIFKSETMIKTNW